MSREISKESAIRNLRRLFGGKDSVSVEEIYTNAGRANMPEEKNKSWRYNTLSTLRPHGLFEEKYGVRNNVRVVVGIRLTNEGKRALRDGPSSHKETALVAKREVSFSSVRADVKELRAKYPEFDITFDAKLKDEDSE